MNDLVARGEGAGLAIIPWATRAALQRPRPLRGGAGRGAAGERIPPRVAVLRVGAGGADRGRRPQRQARGSLPTPSERLSETTQRQWHRLGAGDRGPLAGAAQRRRGRRAPLPRGDRAARPHRGSARSSHAPTSSTANGCAASGGALDAREQLRTAHQMLTAMGIEAFAAARRARAAGHRRDRSQTQRRDRWISSPRERRRSRGSPATASPTPRSAPGCSSAPARSSTTSTRSTASSTSPRATSSPVKRAPR